ncbi:MAG: putative DNA polymerase [Prokaryotic dsDNA virus sp.]|nr:MAG: putative DNA polymerase [Prokaryotic dsDNA virus sp.]|tara:strand:+ start:7076 stop:8974 length:1899 start_codon:yes stop_codon:yes gene_type:complete
MIKYISNKQTVFNNLETATLNDVIDYFNYKTFVAIDTETDGVDWHKNKVIMLQIGDENVQFVIDTRDIDISILRPLFEDDRWIKLGHNLKFDYKFILSSFGFRLNGIYDTMLAEVVLNCGKRGYGYGLDKVLLRYMGVEMEKDTRGEFSKIKKGEPFTENQIIYGAKDVEYLIPIREKQMESINNLDLKNVLDLENGALRAFAEIEWNGMCFDKDRWLELAKNAEDTSQELETELDNIVLSTKELEKFKLPGIQLDMFGKKGREVGIKWSSPSQVTKVLQTLDPSLQNTNMLELFKRQKQHILIKTIIDYRKKAKLRTTYGKEFIKYLNKSSQKIHTVFWQILNTGRVSSGQKGKYSYQSYPNMQNIPADDKYRNCFHAEEGWKLVTMDYSGQELRLIAEGSKDPMWLTAFNKGEDVHGKVAALVFDIDINKVKNKPDFLRGKSYRDVAKTINFGLAYGMSYMKLADTLDIPQTDAKHFIDKYFESLPKIKKFLNSLGNYGKKYGYIKTFKPYRRIRWFEDHKDLDTMPNSHKFQRLGEIERASKNTPIQGSGADMIKQALAWIADYIIMNNLHDKVRIVSQVHDEITCEVREDYVDHWVSQQEKLMLAAGKVICKDVDMVVDENISDKWCK